ncbi:MAG: spore coat protein H [Saprospiraceae bacterium]|jgi:spore coat protein H
MKILFTILLVFITTVYIFCQGKLIFDDSYVHEIRITSDNENDFWNILSTDYLENYPFVPYQMASVEMDGELLDSIGVRQKGFASHFSAVGNKKSIKLDFNQFVRGKEYDGLKKINLNNGAGDPSIQRDKLCYDIMNRAGVSSPRTSYSRVFIDDEYWGLYLVVEQIDKTFIKDNFDNSDGNLLKNNGISELSWMGADTVAYQGVFELKTDYKEGAWDDFVGFMDVINETNDNEFEASIGTVFNVERYLKTLTVDVVTSNWDSYLLHGRNFYLYQDRLSERYDWIPWDYNYAMGGVFYAYDGGGGVVEIEFPESCLTIMNGSCPYPPSDTIFRRSSAMI